MPDPAVPGTQPATETDYVLEQMEQAFVGRMAAVADGFSSQRLDAQNVATQQVLGMGTGYQVWQASYAQTMPGVIANAISQLTTTSLVSLLNPEVFSGRLANSPNPSVPSAAPYYPYGPPSGIPGAKATTTTP